MYENNCLTSALVMSLGESVRFIINVFDFDFFSYFIGSDQTCGIVVLLFIAETKLYEESLFTCLIVLQALLFVSL